jgi:hypothetical protein
MPAKITQKLHDKVEDLEQLDLRMERITVCLRGQTPLLMNSMSAKVKQGLLLPAPKRNRAELNSTLKHNPPEEFVNAMYRYRDDTEPTRLFMPAGAFKSAIATVALRIPGATKTEIGQLLQVSGAIDIPVYGLPQLHMGVVIQAGKSRAPDIRTRAVLPQWCCTVTVTYAAPLLAYKVVGKLIGAAGLLIGIGDGRPEKGKLTYGQFEVANPTDEDVAALIKSEGRVAQDAAIAEMVCYDAESENLLAWYHEEVKRRQSQPPEAPKTRKRKKVNGEDLTIAAEALSRGVDRLGV